MMTSSKNNDVIEKLFLEIVHYMMSFIYTKFQELRFTSSKVMEGGTMCPPQHFRAPKSPAGIG